MFPPTEIEKKKLSSTGDRESHEDGGASGVSASLTPAIWDKTIPYDGENFHLEYMDLDEFLLENQIPAALEEEPHRSLEEESRSASGVPQSSAAVSRSPEKTEEADNKMEDLKEEDEGWESDINEPRTVESAAGQSDFKVIIVRSILSSGVAAGFDSQFKSEGFLYEGALRAVTDQSLNQ